MRTVPERPTLLTVAALFASFGCGPWIGFQLAERFAPDSELALAASVLAFPLAFFAGSWCWLGVGVVAVVARALSYFLRGRLPPYPGEVSDALVPPGTSAFPVCAVLLLSAAGLVVGIVSSASLGGTLLVYATSGAAYGAALMLLARHGYLPFPEPG